MTARRWAATLAVTAFAGAAGCGGDGGDTAAKPPDDAARKASFIARADAVCTKFQQRATQEPGAQTARGTARQVAEARKTAAATLDELRRLDPPAAGRPILDRYFRIVEGSVRDLLPRLERAAERGRQAEARELFAEVTARGDEATRLAQQYGFRVCGSSGGSSAEQDPGA
jgi:hypothetical protein